MLKTLLTGHTSFETAYVVNDYPYGFRLRCKMAYWLETNPKHGTRLMTRTTNPKRAGEVWNKPKASTYAALKVMGLNEVGHVATHGAGLYTDEVTLKAFIETYAAGLDMAYATKMLKLATALGRVAKHITYVAADAPPDPAKVEATNAVLVRAVNIELRNIDAEEAAS